MNESQLERFTHLQVFSHYSLLGGTAAPTALAQQAMSDGLRALALTDLHGLYGAVAFSRACRAARIQPIIGLTVNIAPPVEATLADDRPGKVVLLAKGPAGYRSLCGLSSKIQGSAQREALRFRGVPWTWLKAFADDVIGIDAAHDGWLARYVQADNEPAAARYASLFGGVYEENGYIGVSIYRAADVKLARAMVKVGDRFGLQPAAMQPIYCLQPNDVQKLHLLTAIDQNCKLDMVPKRVLPAGGREDVELHWLSPQDVGERFELLPEAITAVSTITAQCHSALPDGRFIWPALNLPEAQTPRAALIEKSVQGVKQIYGEQPSQAIKDRLNRELKSINRHGFAPLFLLVADITRFARETAVPVNTRGSVANSLVAYSIGITNVDPIAHNLLFERFLNPARANMPDIDLDFCSRRRDEVLKYVRRTYGEDHVALVATMSTLQPKSAVRETAKAYGLAETEIKKLAALLPRRWHPDPRRRSERTLDDVLAEVADPFHKDILEAAFSIIGQPDHLSVHPGGIVITPQPLTHFVPVHLAPKGFLTTQFDYRDVEAIGLPKIDLLGIRALTVLADTVEMIRARHDSDFDLVNIPMDDEETAVSIQNGSTVGVFQCESTGAQRTLRQLQAKNVADLAVANAFFKPGPATGGMAKSFVRRYRGEEAVAYLHPSLQPILQPTQGVLLFQEQVLRVATEVAGLTWAEADHLRRGMSKFKAREMSTMRLSFVTGCRKKSGFTPEQAETLWEQVLAFAGYGFNQGHATAYADVSYRSAYLKVHWPAEFLCARLADHGGFHHPAIYIAEARRLGFGVRPPHVNFSERKFTLVYADEEIINSQQSTINGQQSSIFYMGLGQVRDLRRKSVQRIVAERANGAFTSLRDLLARVALQKKEVIHLVKCGALDGLGESRATMLAEAEGVARAGSALQMSFGFGGETAVSPETITDQLAWETHILGMPMSANP
ncbi:MAG: DNA polymerase III subunit alpha, partial [Chloroflexi bacterium]|nr:DNA polymerase III subunit alpha [Chloroflexota bacterium]